MQPSFAFIPRKVAKRVSNQSRSDIQDQGPSLPPFDGIAQSVSVQQTNDRGTREAEEDNHAEESSNVIARNHHDNQDFAILVSMALSDYSLWAEPDLRRKLEWRSQDEGLGEMTGNAPCTFRLVLPDNWGGL